MVSSAGKTKADVTHERGLALLVDDVIENVRDVRGTVVPVLWDAVYNRETMLGAPIRRVCGWAELAAMIEAGGV